MSEGAEELVEDQVKALVLHCATIELTPVIDSFLSICTYIRTCIRLLLLMFSVFHTQVKTQALFISAKRAANRLSFSSTKSTNR